MATCSASAVQLLNQLLSSDTLLVCDISACSATDQSSNAFSCTGRSGDVNCGIAFNISGVDEL